ncbi:ZYRO0A06380p [Zygosaccharomyces rouxii]|uniref:ZYRO0A06380p n=1 Tax=Zygosaccharomyces rouxii (strain ATCC 2623 / CBS 732 / NBRC 1130 / NCYC 568 / NRRL Y-229) TaxID=559307 RepID=C5DPV4_ZYGRC|nr:uncharacterized protein ZYRO0A06380g [Zygosaccharomyces rouxii]KAH9198764.1 hypothetical protein LQ764DRAFT_235760 [Zygosaccharomyces rouxii]CAR25715.1 ZYRO0A06380p [Zygosaccharomyces rouxii]
MTSKLETLREVSPPDLTRDLKNNSTTGTTNSSTGTNNNKMVGLGLGRRPSDNLLLNMTALEGLDLNEKDFSALSTPPPKKNFIQKSERPISNDSIATRTTELFSATSSDVNSGSSSIDNEQDIKERTAETIVPTMDQEVSQADESMVSTDGDDSHNSPPRPFLQQQQQQHHHHQQQHHQEPQKPILPPTQQQQRNQYIFSNGNRAKSQVALRPPPLHREMMEMAQPPQVPMGPSLYGHSNSTSAILPNKTPLTPSQRYRLRKAQNESALRKSIRKKEKFYDEQETNSQLKNDNFDASLVWNVPMASFSNSSFLEVADLQVGHHNHHNPHPHNHPHNHNIHNMNKNTNNTNPHRTNNRSKHTRNLSDPFHENSNKSMTSNGAGNNKIHPHHHSYPKGLPQPGANLSFLNFYDMPTSPIPGLSKTSDFEYMQQTSSNLTNIYENSSHNLSKSKLTERTASTDFLPLEFKTASDLGFEDLLLVSENKLEVTSHSRPSWLPPKSPEERKMHEEQISKSTSMASIEQLDRNKEKEGRIIKNETNRQKYVLLLDRGITRNSSLQSLRKIVWETALTDEVRYNVYDEVLQSDARAVTAHYLEPYQDMMDLLNKMDFPTAKEKEIEQLIDSGVRNKLSGQQDEISPELLLMLKLKSISRQGLQPGDELLFHHFLQSNSFTDLQQVWEMGNLVQMICFNDICKEKYDSRILNPRGIVAHYLLRSDDFKEEFNATALNSTTWWNVLQRVSHKLFMWIIDIIVVANNQCFKKYPIVKEDFQGKSWEYYRSKRVVNNYKILLAFALNVLLNYHFGFNDLKLLSSLDDPNFAIPMPLDHLLDADAINSMFIRKWLHYYKKF